MQRREFIGVVGGAAAWPLSARAQQAANIPLIAVLMPFKQDDDYRIAALRKGLQETGFIEGQNGLDTS